MEDQPVHDSKFQFFTEDEPKVAEKTKVKPRVRGRRTLADISNMQQGFTGLNQDHKSGPSSDALRKHNEQHQKEKAALMKLMTEKNKVIELSRNEMQKLRVTLEKVKQQNLQLAQANSKMLVELRTAKERLKVLTHELGCKNGLIIAKNLELEGKDITKMCQANNSDHNKVTEPEETEVCTVAEGDDNKHDTSSRRQISQSLAHSNKTVQDNDKGKSKRLQTRRQSAKFNFDEPKLIPNSPKINNIDDENDHDHDDGAGKMNVNSYNAAGSSSLSKMEDKESDSSQDYNKPQEHRKPSLSRPVRKAAKKVQSYKEMSLVVKMRRE